MHPEKWYLVRLFKNSKVLFLLFLLFVFFQSLFNHKRIHSFPWFVWDMYSRVEYVPETVTQTEFFLDGKRLNLPQLSIWEEATVLHTFQKYRHLKSPGNMDPLLPVVESRTRFFPESLTEWIANRILNQPEDIKRYPQWLHQYLTKIMGHTIDTLEIKEVTYRYHNHELKADNQGITLFKTNKNP